MLGPGVWNYDSQPLSPLTEKSPIFQTPQKTAPKDPGIAFSRICLDFWELLDVIWCLCFTKKMGKVCVGSFLRSFGGLLGPKIEMEKVCLDCAGASGSHVRPSTKTICSWIFPLMFWCFCQGPFFMHFGGSAGAKASKICPKRVSPKPRVGILF